MFDGWHKSYISVWCDSKCMWKKYLRWLCYRQWKLGNIHRGKVYMLFFKWKMLTPVDLRFYIYICTCTHMQCYDHIYMYIWSQYILKTLLCTHTCVSIYVYKPSETIKKLYRDKLINSIEK